MFGNSYFGSSYFGDRFFGQGLDAPIVVVGEYFGNRYFGASYFGTGYFGPGPAAVPPVVVLDDALRNLHRLGLDPRGPRDPSDPRWYGPRHDPMRPHILHSDDLLVMKVIERFLAEVQ